MIDLPEPFRTALAEGRPSEVSDVTAVAPEALYARGLARLQLGRDSQAREDFSAALPALGDACRVELAWLDMRERLEPDAARDVAAGVAARSGDDPLLQARALHILGLAEGKLRHTAAATDALLAAAETYRTAGRTGEVAQVQDTLGMVYAASGQLSDALTFYSLSLVEKVLRGDREGVAITLGNMGRIHLRSGRYREAIDCFQKDLAIATELGDRRGQARMHEDIGRGLLGLEQLDEAMQELQECLSIATADGLSDLELFARKDLALVLIRREQADAAAEQLDLAEAILAGRQNVYLETLLRGARAELQRARGDRGALAMLLASAKAYRDADLPDLEIPMLLSATEVLAGEGRTERAEACLRRALRRASADGYARYLPPIREAMAALSVVEGIEDESGQLPDEDDVPQVVDRYTLLAELGAGGFGTVYRAFDRLRNRVVAYKRLELERLYDPDTRRRRLVSARLELESVARMRHPGIARVYAWGTDSGGGTYIVQEYIDGRSLRAWTAESTTRRPDLGNALHMVSRIAETLAELHDHGVVHRDLKPENVIVRPGDDAPVLIDFGIASVPTNPAALGRGAIVGTLEYMSPEQARGGSVDDRSDIYSLGVILFELIAGLRPLRLRGDDLGELLFDLRKRPAPPLLDFRPDAPEPLAQLVRSMLLKKPRRRPDARGVAEACGSIVESLDG